ncbi:porin [Hyphomonas sp. WL0036]|uniref:porin n=1 Tax=Hyphomonas sediminis TaxID=2866160 RepID=UPI001C7E75DD|nr:porin [Hyphomonas sediminis]MBY9065923.1 porin [Hyphomonas sediminis]
MPHARHVMLALAAPLLAAGPAMAQDVWDDAGGIETEFSLEGALVIAPEADQFALGLLKGGLSANYVLDNGVEIGAVGGLEAQRDHPARAGFSGVFPPTAGAGASSGGAFSGLARGGVPEDQGLRASLETAYIYIEGGYGEARLGADEGVATRFFEGGPVLFSHAGLVNPALDPSGALIARTDHDLTGPAMRASYASPRILGLRAGASYTPEADRRGLDRDPARDFPGTGRPEIENAYEFALNLSRRLPQSGVRLRAAAAYSQADTHFPADPTLYGNVETWSAGASAEFSRFTLGGSYLDSNNGAASGPGDYTAWAVSAAIPFKKLSFVAEVSGAEDEFAGLTSDAWQAGIVWTPLEDWRLAAGWRDVDTRYISGGLAASNAPGERKGIVIEITRSM